MTIHRRTFVTACLLAASCGVPEPVAGTGGGEGSGLHEDADASSSGDDGDEDLGGTTGAGGGGGEGSSGGEPDGNDVAGACERFDRPDLAFDDADEDGIDGTLCASIFVDPARWVAGNDGRTPSRPLRTIHEGIVAAAGYWPPHDVLVAEGDYDETVTLRSGVSIYGGYTDAFTRRDDKAITRVRGHVEAAVVGRGLEADVWLQALELVAPDGVAPGQGSVAVSLVGNRGVKVALEHVHVVGGDGARGLAGTHMAFALAGAVGQAGAEGGAGGLAACSGVGGSGGDGLVCPPVPPMAGADVLAAAGGAGGWVPPGDCGGVVCGDIPRDGGDGEDGEDGASGLPGAEAKTGGELDDDGHWVPALAAEGGDGTPGGGGGGGAPASYDIDGGTCGGPISAADGGLGGGGGGGGCGGVGGSPGHAGGSSIAIVVVDSGLELHATRITRGRGGDGGVGGDGGAGGAGGAGGEATSGAGHAAANAGVGGHGGGGGGGGGGAGGCGGDSIAIARRGEVAMFTTGLILGGGHVGQPGIGGHGGQHGGAGKEAAMGHTGCIGELVDVRDF